MLIPKHLFKIMVLFLSLILLIGCENSALQPEQPIDENPTTTTNGVAKLRFIHSASSSDELDVVYYNANAESYYPLHDGTSYGHQYGYYNFYTRDLDIYAITANSDIAVSYGFVALEDSQKYSFIAHDYEATIDPELIVLNDTISSPGSNYSYVRFLHAGSDIDKIYIKNSKNSQLLAIMDPLENSGYKRLESDTYNFTISLSDTGAVLRQMDPLTFLSNHNYTVIISGSVAGMTKIDLNAKAYRETSL
jgi:hypothetical protein